MPRTLVGASVWEEELYEHLISHEANEQELLAEYQEAAENLSSPAFRYLAELIVEDEGRHHRIFRELASALKTDAELSAGQPAVPRFDHWGWPETDKIVELSIRLLDREHTDAKELHRLAGQLKEVKDTTMWQLLVKMMEMDTAKHVEVLKFVKRHATT